jgi:hypothetical protein
MKSFSSLPRFSFDGCVGMYQRKTLPRGEIYAGTDIIIAKQCWEERINHVGNIAIIK